MTAIPAATTKSTAASITLFFTFPSYLGIGGIQTRKPGVPRKKAFNHWRILRL
jgi:hypothetical protein